MPLSLEVLFSPAEFEILPGQDLRHATCVVLDVLRATSSIITAVAHGARAVHPVADIAQALALRQRQPGVLLAGERHGLRIRSDQTGSIDFDLGNSPREFATPLDGRTIVMTTTNGTRALRACAQASTVLIGSFLNLAALGRYLEPSLSDRLILVSSGTFEEAALEDALAAGALCDRLWPRYAAGCIADSVIIARELYRSLGANLLRAFALGRNGKRLLDHPDLRDDLAFCAQTDRYPVLARLDPDGLIRRIS